MKQNTTRHFLQLVLQHQVAMSGESSPLPLPGVPGDLDVGLLFLVDFLLPFVSAIKAYLVLYNKLAKVTTRGW